MSTRSSETEKERLRQHYEENRDQILAESRSRYAANPGARRAYLAEWRRNNREKIRRAGRKQVLKQYGDIDYDQMFSAQGGVCAICGKPEMRLHERTATPISLVVDHDHETGEIRGLLCGRCNKGLGLLGDNATAIRRALAYLERNHG
jgi:hypothetical protein